MLMTTGLRNLYVTIHMRIKNTRKKFKNFKPYWSNELIELWRDMVDSEKKQLKEMSEAFSKRSRLLDRFF